MKSAATAFGAEPKQVVGIRTLTSDGTLDFAQFDEFHSVADLPNSARMLQPGDVLLSIRGSLPKTSMIEYPFSKPTYASGNLAVLRPDCEQLDSAYLWSFLFRISRDEHHPLLTRASTQQLSIRISDLESLQVPIPSLPEQQAIGRAALALRDCIRAQRDVLEQGDRTFRAFLVESFSVV